ncbi:hypothetical protein HGRIS_005374 [Hohenbuehelia grisea]|uniref:Uncharacterized protein n=1 Tax=Hohenbuehelia grisea TaxID=104357 RepID=A0ABR3JFA5_9AGAR
MRLIASTFDTDIASRNIVVAAASTDFTTEVITFVATAGSTTEVFTRDGVTLATVFPVLATEVVKTRVPLSR